MKTSLALNFGSAAPDRRATVARGPTLGSLGPNQKARVTAMRLGTDEAEWLRAIGLFEGQAVEVLRAAPFGGPLHVSTGSGGEFAVDRSLAAFIEVRSDESV